MEPSQIDQILANLCVNARDAIPDIGTVTIKTENVTLDAAYCLAHSGFSPGEYVMIAVSDTGSGMPRETLDHVFEPFFTTKGPGKGTGLGLATVYGIIKQNKGFINVYSETEKGSVLRLYLPRHTEEGPQDARPASMDDAPTGRETIPLVEDEPSILKIAKQRLDQLGYTVLETTNPTEALRIGRETDHVDLIMPDVVMPDMNGRDLAREIEAIHPGTQCLFMSGYTANVIAHHGILDAGLNFISKPFSITDLSIKLWGILESNRDGS